MILGYEGFKMNVMAYTGYTFEYLMENANAENGYLEPAETAGLFGRRRIWDGQKATSLKFMGKFNQRFIDEKSLAAAKLYSLTTHGTTSR